MRDATELVVIIDSSTSMGSCKAEAQPAINAFIKDQANDGTDTVLTLVEFNTLANTIHDRVKLDKDNVPEYTLQPRGMTALYDAIGQTVNKVGANLAAMNEADRPNKVVVMIMTDGEENASREFNASKVKEMVQHQESTYNWKFIYLGANQDAFAVGNTIGTNVARTSNYDVQNFAGACTANSEAIRLFKTGFTADLQYSAAQRDVIDAKNP
jgi:hypothetical protein